MTKKNSSFEEFFRDPLHISLRCLQSIAVIESSIAELMRIPITRHREIARHIRFVSFDLNKPRFFLPKRRSIVNKLDFTIHQCS